MASWADSPKPEDTDAMAYAEAWENRIVSDPIITDDGNGGAVYTTGTMPEPPDVEYADEDEAGQLGLGVPGEQRAIPTLADTRAMFAAVDEARAMQRWRDEGGR